MISAVSFHGRLEKKRDEAREKVSRGPVVVIVGPTDAGKSTLARILLAYAARFVGLVVFALTQRFFLFIRRKKKMLIK